MSLDHELRRSGFTSTDMAAVLGVDARRDLHALWATKIGGLISEPPTWRMRLGHFLEHAVVDIYTDFVGDLVKVQPMFDQTVRHPKFPHIMATPDALVNDDGGVDAKTVTWDQRHLWGEEASDIPDRVQLQLATCMEVFDRDFWDVALLSGDQFRVIRMERDRDFGAFLMNEAERIWQQYFEAKDTPPPIGGSKASKDWLKQKYPRHTTDLRVATDEEIAQLRRYGRVKAALKGLDEERKSLENWIKASIKDGEGLVWPSMLAPAGKFTWKRANDANIMRWEGLAETLLTAHVRLPDDSARDEEAIEKLKADHSFKRPGVRRIYFSSDDSFYEVEEAPDAA